MKWRTCRWGRCFRWTFEMITTFEGGCIREVGNCFFFFAKFVEKFWSSSVLQSQPVISLLIYSNNLNNKLSRQLTWLPISNLALLIPGRCWRPSSLCRFSQKIISNTNSRCVGIMRVKKFIFIFFSLLHSSNMVSKSIWNRVDNEWILYTSSRLHCVL
jgi:hypothetical protein